MVSESKRFVFVHIPRTGGTQVEAGLSEYGKVLQGRPNFDSIHFKHATAAHLRAMMGAAFDTYFRFTIVRNPWDWVVSNYTFNRGLHMPFVAGTPYLHKRENGGRVPSWATGQTFEEWLPWWLDEFRPSQRLYLVDGDERLLVDHIYHFETIEHDLATLCEQLKLVYTPREVDTRSHGRRPHREYYTEQTWRLVAERLRGDVELLGYGD